MATNAKKAGNPLHAALPTLFNRHGDPRRVKGFRGNNQLLTRAIRAERALMSERIKSLTVFQGNCALVLDLETTRLLQECSVDGVGAISSLVLNGFDVVVSDERLAGEIMDFRLQRGLDKLSQSIMVIDQDATEGEDE